MREKFQELQSNLATYSHLLRMSYTYPNDLSVTFYLDNGKKVTASGQLDSRRSMELLLGFFNQVFPIPENDQSYEAIAYNEVAAIWEQWIGNHFEKVPLD